MTFYEVVRQVLDLLQRQGRVSYRALKREFGIDDDFIEDLQEEFHYAHAEAVEVDERGFAWIGDTESTQPPPPTPSLTESTSPPSVEPQPSPISYTPQYLKEKILTSRSAVEGERKVVTVLFADIKDSTEIIKDLDPEDAQKLLDPAIHIMMEAVHRFEGTVNQILGDGIMSIFGAPIAHEDHAARACYAALAMQAAMQDYTEEVRRHQGLELRIRVGLNSGEVVVRTITSDLHMDYSAVGPTTHLAARMEQTTPPGSIRLSASTLRLVEGLVQVNALGPVPVKGIADPVEVFELTGASSIRRRLQAAVARGLTTFVGRDSEIAALNQALEQAGAGHGQVVAAVGEAGVGKSRVAYEFVHSHRIQGWLVLESASVSYGKATPYFPVTDLLKRYVHVEDGDDARTIRAKVTGQILTLDEALQETIPALLSLLDALPEDSPFLQLDPPQRRQRTLDGLKRILLRESQVQPLLLVFEDLHWIDSETQALLDSLIESLPTAQLLLLVNYRPEYNHGWGSKTFYTQLRLDPLPPESADEFLEALLGDDPSLAPLRKFLVERAEGNPFFLEESVRTLVETQVLVGESGAYRLVQELPTIQVPPTVQAVLAARIDRLPQDEKLLLQTASVIGTEIPLTLLQAITEIPDETLYRGLTHLQAAEFLYETSLYPERVYTFRHALTHEVSYGSLLQERRRVLHARIVEALETIGGDRIDDQVERLAHHAFRGEVWDKALMYFAQAGEKSLARSVHREAVSCFEQALVALQHLPESRSMNEKAIDLHINLRQALHPLGAIEAGLTHLREAETLADALGNQRQLGRILSSMTNGFFIIGNHDRALVSGHRALSIAKDLDDLPLQIDGNFYLGQVYWALGDYPRAVDVLGWNVTALQGEFHQEIIDGTGPLAVFSRARLGVCLAEMGACIEGIGYGTEAIRMAESSEYPYSLIAAHFNTAYVYLCKGELQKAISLFERCLEVAHTLEIPTWLLCITSALGYVYALAERLADAVSLLEQALKQVDSERLNFFRRNAVLWLGESALLTCRLDDALTFAEQSLKLFREHKEQGHEAWALRLLGNIAMHHNPPDIAQAQTYYQQSLSLANELSMRPLQAHCHRSLGTLYSQTGQVEHAHTELSTAIAMYREMEMTFWLPETEAKLAEVEGR